MSCVCTKVNKRNKIGSFLQHDLQRCCKVVDDGSTGLLTGVKSQNCGMLAVLVVDLAESCAECLLAVCRYIACANLVKVKNCLHAVLMQIIKESRQTLFYCF